MVTFEMTPAVGIATSADTTSALSFSLLSEIGRQALCVVANDTDLPRGDALPAAVRERLAQEGSELRALLEELAQNIAAGNLTAAQSRLTAVLTPVRCIDETYYRFCKAQREAQSTLGAVQAAGFDSTQPLGAGQLRQLHASASAVAAAFDELAVCAQAWVDLIDPEANC